MPRPVIRPYTASVQFDGSASELVKATPTGLNTGTDALSFVSWVYPKGSGLQVFADLLGGAMGRRFSIGGSAGVYYFFSDGVNAANNMTLTAAQYFAAFRPDAPARAVWTVDATEAQLYVNGVLIKTQALGLGMNSGTYTKLTIGRSGSATFGFNGWANDAYFANKKMTLADVQADYFSATQPSNVASAWLMGEGAGTDVADSVGSNSLTASSITWSGYAPFKLRNRVLDIPSVLTSGVVRSDAGSIDVNTSGATAIFRYYPISADGLVACSFEDAATSATFRLNLESTTRRLFTWTVSGGVGRAHKPTYAIPLSEWHEVAVSYKDMGGGNRRSRIYVDGVLIGEDTSAGLADTTSRFSCSTGSTRYQTKTRMFNSELTPEQVSKIYSTGQNLVTPRIHWPLTEGSGNVANDISGNGFHGTISSNAWGSLTPGKKRKVYGGNLVENGNFEVYPPFTAVTSSSPKWVDGTSAGSSTNDSFGWYYIVGVGSFNAAFDASVKFSGSASMKIEATTITGRGRVMTAPFEGATTADLIKKYGFQLSPNTTYRISFKGKANNVGGDSNVALRIIPFNSAGTNLSTVGNQNLIDNTDWTDYTTTFTTAATTAYGIAYFIWGAAGTIGQAWVDDITVVQAAGFVRQKSGGNLVKNGGFEDVPAFTAATTGDLRWIDGTAAGSASIDSYGWGSNNNAGVGQAQFDTSVSHSGSASLKISTTAPAQFMEVSNYAALNTLADQIKYGIKVRPNTTYRLTYWMKTNYISGDATTGARFDLIEMNELSTTAVASNTGTAVKNTQDWTQYTTLITTNSATTLVRMRPLVYGHQGAATLVMDAWFDDISLTPVYPDRRDQVGGNLVKNFDFEVVPTFVAATDTTTKWIDGTAAGNSTNSTYKWGINSKTGTASAQFDSTTFFGGASSMKLSTVATGSNILVKPLLTTSLATLSTFAVRALPSTSYTGTFRMKTSVTSGDSNDGAFLSFIENDGVGSNVGTNVSTKVKTTVDWTLYTFTFTTTSTTAFLVPTLNVTGNTGTATLIMDAWFDDITLGPTYSHA